MAGTRLQSILETAVYVDDLGGAERFYGDLLGLERITRVEGRHVFFRRGDEGEPPPPDALPVPPHGADGPGHVCFAVAAEDIDPLMERLAGEGVEIEADFRWPHGPRSVYVRDPFGNSVEFAEPNLWDRMT